MSEVNTFSQKQMKLLTWWCRQSDDRNYDAIICDGAVRSGKTFCMSLSFVLWAFSAFSEADFAMCAKTITSLRRNVVTPLLARLKDYGFSCEEKVSRNYIDLSWKNRKNRFYLFGGKDEGSASLIQGITLSGVLLDEVALMPRSFVEQALARCSVTGSKFWFNCNPEHPFHWFYQEWILKRKEKNALYLHFLMNDNPSLSPEILKRYQSLYSGTFYQRFVEGKWVSASGLVYPMFDPNRHLFEHLGTYSTYYISCDYGTVNPTSMGLWGECDGIWYRLQEYYYDSRREQRQKTDEEYYWELERLAGERKIQSVIVDPSAASFMECIRRHGRFHVQKAQNDVISGIRRVGEILRSGQIRIHCSCRDSIREFSLYVWEDGQRCDIPKKENDHAMDDIRYFVNTVLNHKEEDFFFISSVDRN
jgi:PBSX family phage terminase large subunit